MKRRSLPLLFLPLLSACPRAQPADDDDAALAVAIAHSPVTEVEEGQPIELLATVTLSGAEAASAPVPTVVASYQAPDAADWVELPMSSGDGSAFAGTIPAAAVVVGELRYFLRASSADTIASDPASAPQAYHAVWIVPRPLASPDPVRARYDAATDDIVLTWSDPDSGAFIGYSVTAEPLDGGGEPATVCQGSAADTGCTVPAGGVYDTAYARWTVTFAEDGGSGGVSASGVTDGLHLWLETWAKEPTAEDPLPWGSGAGEFNLPYGIAVSDARIHVVEQNNHRLQHFTLDGVFQGFTGAGDGGGASGTADGEFNAPHDAALGPDGGIYVADHNNARVQVFTGEPPVFARAFGSLGSGDGQLRFPVGLDFDGDGVLHVAESVNARVSTFDADGNFLGVYDEIDGHVLAAPSRIAFLPAMDAIAVADGTSLYLRALGEGGADATWPIPGASGSAVASGICATRWGEVLVLLDDPGQTAGSTGHRVVKLDAAGTEIGGWGGWGGADGQFFRPVDCAVSAAGEVHVADALNYRVQRFGP